VHGTELYAMKCLDAVSLADQREIFVIELDFFIKSFQGFCMVQKDKNLQIENCKYAEDKWIFDQQGRILHQQSQLCLTLLDQSEQVEIQSVTASSELEDLQHSALRILDKNPNTYWATFEEHASLSIVFPFPTTISAVSIDFQYLCAEFEILYQFSSIWKSLKHFTGN